MKRRCEETVPLLGPWLDGELAEEDLAWVEEHAGECDPCGQRKALLAATRDAENNPDPLVNQLADSLAYVGHPYGFSPEGNEPSLRSIIA